MQGRTSAALLLSKMSQVLNAELWLQARWCLTRSRARRCCAACLTSSRRAASASSSTGSPGPARKCASCWLTLSTSVFDLQTAWHSTRTQQLCNGAGIAVNVCCHITRHIHQQNADIHGGMQVAFVRAMQRHLQEVLGARAPRWTSIVLEVNEETSLQRQRQRFGEDEHARLCATLPVRVD
jgi:hypothetical protein